MDLATLAKRLERRAARLENSCTPAELAKLAVEGDAMYLRLKNFQNRLRDEESRLRQDLLSARTLHDNSTGSAAAGRLDVRV